MIENEATHRETLLILYRSHLAVPHSTCYSEK